jgi:hypothetical protein
LLSTIFAVIGLASSDAAVRPSDLRATRLLLRAVEGRSRAQLADAPAQRTARRALVAQLGGECKDVLASAPLGSPQIELIFNEIGVALDVPGETIERSAVVAFDDAVRPLRWSDRRVTRSVSRLTEEERGEASVAAPPLCADLRSWVSSSYREAPASARALANAQLLSAFAVTRVEVVRSLMRYVGPKLRALARHAETLARNAASLQIGIALSSATEASERLGSRL